MAHGIPHRDDRLTQLLQGRQRSPISQALTGVGRTLQGAGLGLLGKTLPAEKPSLADELTKIALTEELKGELQTQRQQELLKSFGFGEGGDEGILGQFPPGTTLRTGPLSIPLVPKKSAAQEKREVEASELSQGLEGLLTSFDRAVTAGKKQVPLFGARGPVGRVAGFVGRKLGEVGLAPEIDVFNAQKDAFATTVAKAAGEVRPTDEDIRRFVKTLPSPDRSDEENALIVQDIRTKISQGKTTDLWKRGASPTEAANTLITPSGISFSFRRK